MPAGNSAGMSLMAPPGRAGIAPIPLPVATARLYEVRTGDTLWSIAGRHGLSLAQLCEWNDLDPARPIHPGAVLTLPAGAREIAQEGETA